MNTAPSAKDIDAVIAFAEANGVRPGLLIRADALARYGNAHGDAAQAPRVLAYAHALLDAFPHPDDERPARALCNWRHHFAEHAETLKRAIAAWKADPKCQQQRTLTDVIWHTAAILESELPADQSPRGNNPFWDFDSVTSRFFLRFGIIDLAKVLCREVEADSSTQVTPVR